MNIFEIAETFQLSLTKVKRMERAGVLIVDAGEGHPLAPAMRDNLRNQQDLSVLQLLALIETPKVMAELRTRQSQAKKQIADLGDFRGSAMPLDLVKSVRLAAENDPKRVKAVIDWAKSVLPGSPVPYAFLGVRAGIAIIPAGRNDFLTRFAQALMNCRRSPEFAPYFRSEQRGSRKRMIYFNTALDL